MEILQSPKTNFLSGIRDGLPIGLGYISVSFALGIYAGKAGLTPFWGFLSSFFNHASAGEYSGYLMIIQESALIELVLITLVANVRYLLMSSVLSQVCPPRLSIGHRMLVGFCLTDEIFAATISRKEEFSPFYTYGLAAIAITMWSVGTSLGIVLGNILPARVVSALSVALYGMFIAVVIPAAKENRHVSLFVFLSFLISWVCSVIEPIRQISGGVRTVILTICLSSLAAVLFPLKEEENE